MLWESIFCRYRWQQEMRSMLSIQGKEIMDIIPLEISRIDQLKVYTLQVICYTMAKALYTV